MCTRKLVEPCLVFTSQCLNTAKRDNTIEAPIIATEFVTDPAAPTSGPGAGANEGLRS
ncbi:unnamed protein product [Trifolium pratense]|uniref:Uncharacterized protein n=1 Tax=Trifolium pratense TaxID=57577 RepID=A0ACB0J4E9_TRIPR|nr:unnamed protein product [Trifolium pratense]